MPAPVLQPTDPQAQRINTETLRLVSRVPMLDGRLLERLSVTTSAQLFPHGLGRRPRGFLVVTRDANSVIYEDRTARSESYISLRGGAATVADIWVF